MSELPHSPRSTNRSVKVRATAIALKRRARLAIVEARGRDTRAPLVRAADADVSSRPE